MTIYYLIRNRRLGKKDESGYFLFEKGKWVADEKNVIKDYLMGFDPSEPEDSPYRMYNLSVMDEIEEIAEEQAVQYMNRQTVDLLKEQ